LRNRVALIAVALSLALTGVLVVRIIAIDKPEVVVILIPALIGALLAIWKPGRAVLLASAFLTATTAMVILLGGVGLLYLPSIVMFIWGAASAEQRAVRSGSTAHV
jgi:hypothetical protein